MRTAAPRHTKIDLHPHPSPPPSEGEGEGGGVEGDREQMTQPVIMVVEDNQANRELAVALLTAAGYTILTAEDGRGLIERVKRKRPNLILIDLQLPYIDGLTLTRQLKADAETQEIPVLMATARIYPEQEAMALEAGCAGYFTKPLDHRILRITVARLLNR